MMNFTPEQSEIINYLQGSACVIAGAGSGKTRCLIERTANLIENGEAPDKILLFTFTKKAAKEIAERLTKRLDVDSLSCHVSTIHSLALRIFRENKELLNFENNATIWQPARRANLLKVITKQTLTNREDPFGDSLNDEDIAELFFADELDGEEEKELKNVVKDVMEIVKGLFLTHPPTPQRISGMSVKEYHDRLIEYGAGPVTASIATEYLAAKEGCNVIEFDDMIPAAIRILQDFDTEWNTAFNHIMVDEYQDVNDINVEFIEALLHEDTQSLMAVGDDDQAIYGFRGGNNKHILEYQQCFGGELLFLTTNFRSCHNIVETANRIITNNTMRYEKQMVPFHKDKAVITEIEPFDGNDQRLDTDETSIYQQVWEYIYNLIDFCEMDPNDIAILARNNFNLIKANACFERMNSQKGYTIPFHVGDITSPFENKYIKRITQWINIFLNQQDIITIREAMMNTFKGFGNKSAEYLTEEHKLDAEAGLVTWLRNLKQYPRHGERTKKYQSLLQYSNEVESALRTIEEEPTVTNYWNMAKILSKVETDAYNEAIGNNKMHRYEMFKTHRHVCETFIQNYEGKIEDLLDEIATEVELSKERSGVDMMTIHSSKGKEWKYVFIIDIQPDILPSRLADDVEEERRLFYVGITRAEEGLILCRNEEESHFMSDFWVEYLHAIDKSAP